MKSQGSLYVTVVVALLAAYFSYQWWFNPHRAVKRRLGELAATLSVPAGGQGDLDRIARLAQLRNYFAPDVAITTGGRGPAITSREALVAAVSAWKPSVDGWNVDFVDVQVMVGSDETARAYMTVEVTSRDPASGQRTFDAREVTVEHALLDGSWVITSAAPAETLQRP
jgi:hypothetical protein